MLIVIVIIGILTAAIIPRLNSARGRANDVARKADLNQVATALITFQLDRWHFPRGNSGWTWVTIDKISSELIEWGMTSIPKDPANSSRFSWSNELTNPDTPFNWYYIYQTIKKAESQMDDSSLWHKWSLMDNQTMWSVEIVKL